MTLTADITIKAQFHDLDPLGIVWHGNYVRYFEQARCALLDRIGYNYDEMHRSGYTWPVVDLHVRYIRPVRFYQDIIVAAELMEFENRLKVAYRVRDADTGEILTKGHTIQVAVHAETGELCLESPAALTDKIRGPT